MGDRDAETSRFRRCTDGSIATVVGAVVHWRGRGTSLVGVASVVGTMMRNGGCWPAAAPSIAPADDDDDDDDDDWGGGGG